MIIEFVENTSTSVSLEGSNPKLQGGWYRIPISDTLSYVYKVDTGSPSCWSDSEYEAPFMEASI